MHVAIYLNNNHRDATVDGYQTHHTVTEALTYPVRKGDGADPLGYAFHLCNVGDDPEFVDPPDDRAVKYRHNRNRSLSVGDVIALVVSDNGERKPVFFAVASSGFRPILAPTRTAAPDQS